VTVERSDTDAGTPGDLLQRTFDAMIGKDVGGNSYELVAVAQRIGTHASFGLRLASGYCLSGQKPLLRMRT
jgi:hypothetical protein